MRRNPVRTLVVNEADSGLTLAAYLTRMLPETQQTLIPDVLRRGGAWVGKWRRTDPDHRLSAGDTLRIATPPGGAYDSLLLTADLIVANDRDWLVVNKPSGWYSQETPWDTEGNLVGAVRRFLQRPSTTPAPDKPRRQDKASFLHQVNRLDRETSGLVLFAHHGQGAAAMQAAQDGGATHKRYLAVVRGAWQGPERFEAPIASAGAATFKVDPAGKPSTTEFRLMHQGPDWSLIEARPVTGRTHQIRVHAAHLGHPLLGDERYGGGKADRRLVPNGFLLHAGSLTVWLKDGKRHWAAPPPDSFLPFLGTADTAAFWAELNWQSPPEERPRGA